MVSALGVDFDLHLERFDRRLPRNKPSMAQQNRKLFYPGNICKKCFRMSLLKLRRIQYEFEGFHSNTRTACWRAEGRKIRRNQALQVLNRELSFASDCPSARVDLKRAKVFPGRRIVLIFTLRFLDSLDATLTIGAVRRSSC
jgi:hypothetical protein